MEKFKVERELKDLTNAELLDIYEVTVGVTEQMSQSDKGKLLREEIVRRMDKPPVYYNQLQQFGGLGHFAQGVAK